MSSKMLLNIFIVLLYSCQTYAKMSEKLSRDDSDTCIDNDGGSVDSNGNSCDWYADTTLGTDNSLNLWIASKFIGKVADGDVTGANTYLRFSLSAWYTIALCFILGSMASNTTTLVLLGTDFTANAIIMLRVILLRKMNPEEIELQIDLLQEMAIYELVEFVAPTVVILTFGLLVLGPNCELIGNLCNSYWQFVGIQDMAQAFENMVTFWFVDILSTMITTVTIKLCCGINMLNIMMELLREFRFVFCAVTCMRMCTYLGTHMVGAGMDWTMRFDWVDGNWNKTMISMD